MVIKWSGNRPDEGEDAVSIETLYRDIPGVEYDDADSACPVAELTTGVKERLAPEGAFEFDEAVVKQSLDELLLVLVALRSEGSHGKGLMSDLSDLFDVRPSAGTVYPRLHELEEAGLLERHELIQTKEYHLDDVETARNLVEAAMYQHLAFVLVFNTALEEMEP